MENKKLDISWEAILKVSVAAAACYFLFLIQDIIVWFIFALIISVLFEPTVDYLVKKKVPRILGVILVYLLFFGAFAVLIYMAAPIFAKEIQNFVQYIPQYLSQISSPLKQLGFKPIKDIQDLISVFGGEVQSASSTVLSGFFAFFGGMLTTLFIITTALFFSIEGKAVERFLMLVLPKRHEAAALNIWARCQKRVVGWFMSRIISCIFVGVASYAAFLILKVEYPFTLALFAGVFNFVPYIGPLITGALLLAVIAADSISKIILVFLAFLLIQKIEGVIISPILTKRIIGIPSSVVILALVIGGELWGIMGAILVIPMVGILYEFFREFLMRKREKEAQVL